MEVSCSETTPSIPSIPQFPHFPFCRSRSFLEATLTSNSLGPCALTLPRSAWSRRPMAAGHPRTSPKASAQINRRTHTHTHTHSQTLTDTHFTVTFLKAVLLPMLTHTHRQSPSPTFHRMRLKDPQFLNFQPLSHIIPNIPTKDCHGS